jgi:hypothetical protein
MLLKAGIVAAVAAGSLVAVSPLAFAGDYDHGKSHHKSHKSKDNDDNDKKWRHKGNRDGRGGGNSGDCNSQTNNANVGNSGGLVNISHVNAAVPVNVCDNDILSGVLGILSSGLQNNDNH